MANYTWNGAAGDYLDPAQWTPNDVPLYGSDTVATVGSGAVTLSDAEPNGITLALGAGGTFYQIIQDGRGGLLPVPDVPILVLSNGALGPDMALDVFSPARLIVEGDDTNYGQINVAPFGDTQALGNSRSLYVSILGGSQLNQEGTIAVITPQTVSPVDSRLTVLGGTLNNDGQIFIGPGSAATFGTSIIGSGTITVDHATVFLDSTASTQTVDLLGGRLTAPLTLEATIKDWNSDGHMEFGNVGGAGSVSSAQFNQTSDAGGDLQLFGASGAQVGDLHLLGTYATSDFTITRLPGASGISVSGIAPPSV